MFTSYFAINGNNPNAVAICLMVPVWFKGRTYPQLAPPLYALKDYLAHRDVNKYVQVYKAEVLDKLDADQVYKDLGENAVLLCYEKSGTFCHRYIAAAWLELCLGIQVEEIDNVKKRR